MAENTIRIRDNVHGTIVFEECFQGLLTSKFFKRLHNITQMGMIRQVFPAAVHTRFSHSLGVYQTMSKLLNAVSDNLDNNDKPSVEERFFLRTAALLHDIGHFPLSHTVERALERFEEFELPQIQSANRTSANALFDYNGDVINGGPVSQTKAALHEQLSAEIIKTTNISDRVRAAYQVVRSRSNSCFNFQNITYGILGESSELVSDKELEKDNLYYSMARFLLHSQLDADRLDYLLRDSMSAGVKPGGFDIDKLISEIKIIKSKDPDGNTEAEKYYYGVTEKGLRNIEEYILTRAYNYLEIVYDPVSHGIGMMAEEFYYQLLLVKQSNCIKKKYLQHILTYKEIKALLNQAEGMEAFCEFDDHAFANLVKLARAKAGADTLFKGNDFPRDGHLRSKTILQTMAEMLSDGTPPLLIWRNEFTMTEAEHKARNKLRKPNDKDLSDRLLGAIKESGLNTDQLLISDKKSRVKLVNDDEFELISIFGEDDSLLCKDFTEYEASLFYPLKGCNIYVDAVFYIAMGDDPPDTHDKVKKFIECMN